MTQICAHCDDIDLGSDILPLLNLICWNRDVAWICHVWYEPECAQIASLPPEERAGLLKSCVAALALHFRYWLANDNTRDRFFFFFFHCSAAKTINIWIAGRQRSAEFIIRCPWWSRTDGGWSSRAVIGHKVLFVALDFAFFFRHGASYTILHLSV